MADRWTTETAAEEFGALAKEVEDLMDVERFSEAHTRWIMRTHRSLEEVLGRNSRHYQGFASLSWAPPAGRPFIGLPDPATAVKREHRLAYQEQLRTAKGILQDAEDVIRKNGIDEVYEGKDTAPESSVIVRVINLAERGLRKAIREPPESERAVQDAFQSLLIGGEFDYSRETDSIEYSSKTYTPDFTFPKIDLALEVKLCGRAGREKEIIAEINDDILAYETKYGNLLFVIYDVGFIRDVDRFAESFESHPNVIVSVVKH